jgi:hypothetical protein
MPYMAAILASHRLGLACREMAEACSFNRDAVSRELRPLQLVAEFSWFDELGKTLNRPSGNGAERLTFKRPLIRLSATEDPGEMIASRQFLVV